MRSIELTCRMKTTQLKRIQAKPMKHRLSRIMRKHRSNWSATVGAAGSVAAGVADFAVVWEADFAEDGAGAASAGAAAFAALASVVTAAGVTVDFIVPITR